MNLNKLLSNLFVKNYIQLLNSHFVYSLLQIATLFYVGMVYVWCIVRAGNIYAENKKKFSSQNDVYNAVTITYTYYRQNENNNFFYNKNIYQRLYSQPSSTNDLLLYTFIQLIFFLFVVVALQLLLLLRMSYKILFL